MSVRRRIAFTRATAALSPRSRHVAVACLLCVRRTRTTPFAAPACRLLSPRTEPMAPRKAPKPCVSLDRSSDAAVFKWPVKMLLAHLIELSAYPLIVGCAEHDMPSTLNDHDQDEALGCDASSSDNQVEEHMPPAIETASATESQAAMAEPASASGIPVAPVDAATESQAAMAEPASASGIPVAPMDAAIEFHATMAEPASASGIPVAPMDAAIKFQAAVAEPASASDSPVAPMDAAIKFQAAVAEPASASDSPVAPLDAASSHDPKSQAAAVDVTNDASINLPSQSVQDLIRFYESRSSASFTVRPAPLPSTLRCEDWIWRHVRHSTYECPAICVD